MKTSVTAIIVLSIQLITGFGCSPVGCDEEIVIYTDTLVELHPGRQFRVSLRNNSLAGDKWLLMDNLDTDLIRLVEQNCHEDQHEMGLVGGFSACIWLFEAVAPGETRVKLGRFIRGGPIAIDTIIVEIIIN